MYFSLFKKLLSYILDCRFKIVGTVVLSFVLAGLSGLQVALIRPLVDKGLAAGGNMEETYGVAAKLLLLGIINFPCRFFHFYWIRYVMDKAVCRVRSEMFAKLLKLPFSYFSKNKQGQAISHLINDTQIFAEGFKAIIDLIREPLKAVVYLSMAFWADWPLTMIILGATPFFWLTFKIGGEKVKKSQIEVQKEHGELTHNISETFKAGKVIRAFDLNRFVSNRFLNSQNRFFNAQMRTTLVEELAHPFIDLIGAAVFSGVILFAYYRIESGEMTTGDFIAFITSLALLMDPIRKFSQANIRLGQAAAAKDRMHTFMDLEEEYSSGAVKLTSFQDSLEIKNLNFSYEEKCVLKNINISIKKGQKVGLVGLSGSGKSTLVHLLLGLYEVERGVIFIDGRDVRDMELSSLRSLFGLVGQDIFLFHDTLRENLTLGRELSQEDIFKALQISHAMEFVKKLPKGPDTVIGEQGTRLSGGQQQRLTIARAFLQKSDILLFDEATSALDNESETVVQQAMEELAGDKTVIAVAHRLSTLQGYDCIYVMNEGKIVESGTHEELIDRGGEYAKLYRLSKI